jgi:hypothetical protein
MDDLDLRAMALSMAKEKGKPSREVLVDAKEYYDFLRGQAAVDLPKNFKVTLNKKKR